MKGVGAQSDQLYTWSDRHAEHPVRRTATPSQNAFASAAATGRGAARLSHRTLQALQQAGLQMRPGTRPRAQVLFVGESHRRAPRNGLCPPRPPTAGGEVFGQLPADPQYSRGALRDQSRAPASARAILSSGREGHDAPAHRSARHASRRHPHREHARSLARGGHTGLRHWGGKR